MGKTAEDFDGQITPIRIAYLKASGNDKWITACHYAYMMNKAVRPSGRISDLIPFYASAQDMDEELTLEEKARQWCLMYVPMIEDAIAQERDKLLAYIDR